MQFKILLYYLLGYVRVEIEGFFIEKFINICTYRNIKLNNVKRLNGCVLEAQVSINDFRKLRDVCKKTKCRLKILDKKGVPFFLYRYRKRKIIILPIVLILILIICVCVGSKGSRDLEAGGVHVLCLMEGECVCVLWKCVKAIRDPKQPGH